MIGSPLVTLLVLALVILAGAGALATYQVKTTHFDCPACGRSFQVSVAAYFFAQHTMSGRYVTCPYCFNTDMLPPIPNG